MEITEKVNELQTTVDNLRRQLDEAESKLKRAIESDHQPQIGSRERELIGQIQRRKLLPDVRLRSIRERARG